MWQKLCRMCRTWNMDSPEKVEQLEIDQLFAKTYVVGIECVCWFGWLEENEIHERTPFYFWAEFESSI